MTRAVLLSSEDDVVVLVDPAEAGADVFGIVTKDPVPSAHKVALHAIGVGDTVHKYGQAIGVATRPIDVGEHVHSHNLEVGGERSVGTAVRASIPRAATGATFLGYARANGRVGTRNFIGVLSSVNCSATVCRRIAAAFDREPSSKALMVFPLSRTRAGAAWQKPARASRCSSGRSPAMPVIPISGAC